MTKSDSALALPPRGSPSDLLQVIEAAGDSLIAGRVESIKCDAGSAIDAGVHFRDGSGWDSGLHPYREQMWHWRFTK